MHMYEEECVDSFAEFYILLWHLRACSEAKVIGFEGDGVWLRGGKHLQPPCEASQLNSDQQKRPDQTQRRSALFTDNNQTDI